MAYLIGSLAIFNVCAIIYDAVTGDADQLLSPSGHCNIVDPDTYNIMYVMIAYTTLNKAVQIGLFAIYLYFSTSFPKKA